MESVVYWNHSTSLQVPYSLQHLVLVLLKEKKKKNYLVHLFQISGINLNGIHNIASFGKNYSLLALATSNNHHTAFKHLNETDNFFSYP